MKILHILEGLFLGGTENVVMNWNRHISHPLFQFDFLINNIKKICYEKEIKELGGKILIVNQRSAGIKSILKYTYTVYDLLRKNNYDTVIAHMGYISGFELMAAWFAGIPKRISVSHMGYYYDTSKIKIWLYKFLIWVFATDCWAVSEQAGKNLFWSHFEIVKNGIDLKRFQFNKEARQNIRKRLDWNDSFIIGIVGRLEKEKNHQFLLNVFKSLSVTYPTMRLLIIGSGSLKSSILTQIKESNLTDKVKMTDAVSNIEDFYSAMDCLVIPSLYEGFSLTALEAQAEGLSVFVSENVPHIVQIINTKILPLSNITLWMTGIENTFHNQIVRDSIKAVQTIRQAGFDIQVEVKRIEKLLQDIKDTNETHKK